MKVYLLKKIRDHVEKEKHPYFLEFVIPKEHMGAPHLNNKDLNFQCTNSGLLILPPFPKEINNKLDVTLGKIFKSSKWRDRNCITMTWFLSCFIFEDLNLMSLFCSSLRYQKLGWRFKLTKCKHKS